MCSWTRTRTCSVGFQVSCWLTGTSSCWFSWLISLFCCTGAILSILMWSSTISGVSPTHHSSCPVIGSPPPPTWPSITDPNTSLSPVLDCSEAHFYFGNLSDRVVRYQRLLMTKLRVATKQIRQVFSQTGNRSTAQITFSHQWFSRKLQKRQFVQFSFSHSSRDLLLILTNQ